MQTVDRQSFILWQQGTFIKVDKNDIIRVDERSCLAACKALERGEIIALLQDGVIVSYVIPGSDCHREIGLDEYEKQRKRVV